ncbi:MAG TPA: hypothetical protein VFS07_03890 [Gemmatimonadales bacterium]|jgi:hypothetical protein|nr:hypothetical protein [Gemmatimonadales bacterium]
MSLLRTTIPVLALVSAGAGTLTAQIPLNRRSGPSPAAPRLLVATPFTERANDSAVAVTIGDALRTRMQRVTGNSYLVLTRKQMNDALAEYSYPADPILNRESARRLAQALLARTMVFTELGRESGRYKARVRLAGNTDDAGVTLTVLQQPGQSPQQFGEAIANVLDKPIDAYGDAKACIDQEATDARRAEESARKALRQYPMHGLAHFCLAELAKTRSVEDPAYLAQLDSAVHGDSLSLKALGALADYYDAKSDTANVVLKYQQMIEADPVNVPLIELASRVFRKYGRPDAAEQVADRGIALDSTSTNAWDLRASACVYQQKYSCAVQSLEQIVAIDSTKADSLFLFRMAVTAGAAATDSADLRASWLKWSRVGATRFPQNKNLLGQLLQAFSASGMPDSALALTDQVLALDSSDVTPALGAVDILLNAKRWADAAKYAAVVTGHGDDQQKLAIAANFTNAARTLLTTEPTDPEGAYALLHVALPASGGDQRIAPLANFLMGFAALQTAAKYDHDAEAGKSCELATRMDQLLDESKAGFTAGRSINPPTVDSQLPKVDQYKTRTQSMVRAYCH